MTPIERLAIVTGASSGIGAATARALARRGWRVVLAARRAERLQQLAAEINSAGGRAECFPVDLSGPAGRQALYAAYPQADLLLNNAGFGWYGYAEDLSWELAAALIETNDAAVVQLCLLYLPGMRARRRGHIINIGSIAGELPNHGVALYSASKTFVHSFTTAIYRELKGSGVQISVVIPGPVQTEFFERARQVGGSVPAESLAVPAEAVAKCILGLLDHPRRVAFVPWFLCFAPLLEHWFGWIIDLLGPILLKRK
jgi:short-subunit dehydrogenase